MFNLDPTDYEPNLSTDSFSGGASVQNKWKFNSNEELMEYLARKVPGAMASWLKEFMTYPTMLSAAYPGEETFYCRVKGTLRDADVSEELREAVRTKILEALPILVKYCVPSGE